MGRDNPLTLHSFDNFVNVLSTQKNSEEALKLSGHALTAAKGPRKETFAHVANILLCC